MVRVGLLAVVFGLGSPAWAQPEGATPGQAAPGSAAPAVLPGVPVPDVPTPAPGDAAPGAPATARGRTPPGALATTAAKKPKPERVKLSFRSSPGGASVYFGKRMLGTTPFELDWKRDSGPLDVAVRMGGYFTVNTRIYTLRDDTLSVKMTRLSDGHTLYGYKAPLKGASPRPSGDEDAPDN